MPLTCWNLERFVFLLGGSDRESLFGLPPP